MSEGERERHRAVAGCPTASAMSQPALRAARTDVPVYRRTPWTSAVPASRKAGKRSGESVLRDARHRPMPKTLAGTQRRADCRLRRAAEEKLSPSVSKESR